jgi:hypothetical protein
MGGNAFIVHQKQINSLVAFSFNTKDVNFKTQTTFQFVILFYLYGLVLLCEPRSSVSMVSGYGLDHRAIHVRFPAGAKDFSSNLCVQTGSGVHFRG